MTKKEYDQYVEAFRRGVEGLEFLSVKSEEPYFSHTSCDICSRPLGGDRYDMTYIAGITGKFAGNKRKSKRRIKDQLSACQDCVYFAAYGQLDDMTMLKIAEDEKKENQARVIAIWPKQYERGLHDARVGSAYGHSNQSTDAKSDAWEAYRLGWERGRDSKKGKEKV